MAFSWYKYSLIKMTKIQKFPFFLSSFYTMCIDCFGLNNFITMITGLWNWLISASCKHIFNTYKTISIHCWDAHKFLPCGLAFWSWVWSPWMVSSSCVTCSLCFFLSVDSLCEWLSCKAASSCWCSSTSLCSLLSNSYKY